ncbi:hypothetical protein [Vibrio campbellii]|uniref:hypothetical protein n=1 Tax=Vibrio campbellii TaxID=680 RepID=UPI00210A811A|nr:hypothetical protein [Vibrio campbellii]
MANRLPLSLEHPSMRDVFNYISQVTGLEFKLPDATYVDKVIPNFVNQSDGYQCLDRIGKAFSVPDYIWFQDTDQVIYFGAYEDSHFHGKKMNIDHDFTQRQNTNSVTFPPFPMLRPGRFAFDKRIVRVDLIGDEMTAFWVNETMPTKRREMADLFPEVANGYHLPILGRVEAVRDNANSGQIADPFRPRFAVDVQVLDANMNPDINVPVYRSIPLPVNMSGHESGFLAHPLEGTVVEIAFAYGRSDRPLIRGVYGKDYALPTIEPGEQLQQQREEVSRRVDAAGNVTDKTDQIRQQKAHGVVDESYRYELHTNKHRLNVGEHSEEYIVGKKLVEALGAIELLAGDNMELGSLGNMHVATAGELITVVGQLRNVVVTLDDKLKVIGSRIGVIEENDSLTVGGSQRITIEGSRIIKAKDISENADIIMLNGGTGVCTGATDCPFTGRPHVDVSRTVFAGK